MPFTFVLFLLFITIPAILSYQKDENLYLTMSLRSPVQGDAGLYYDSGDGFREKDKAVIQIGNHSYARVYAFPLPNRDLFRFRFDPPPVFDGPLSVGNIRIVTGRGKTLKEIDIHRLKPLRQIRTFQHTGSESILTVQDGADDPQVMINLDSPYRPGWAFLSDWSFLGFIACEMVLIILIYFTISYLWPRWRVHPKRKTILITFLFVYAGGLWALFDKATTTYLKVTMQSSSYGTAQLYFDTGSGYSEESSDLVDINGGTNFSDYLFSLPNQTIRQLRFDPLQTAGRFVISRMEVVDGLRNSIHSIILDQTQPAHDIQEYAIINQNLEIVTEEPANDPQLIVNLLQPLHIRSIDLLWDPFFYTCVLSLFILTLLSIAALVWISEN
jgi:hypothetical protein